MAILKGFPTSSQIMSWHPPIIKPQPKKYSVEELRAILDKNYELMSANAVIYVNEFLNDLETG